MRWDNRGRNYQRGDADHDPYDQYLLEAWALRERICDLGEIDLTVLADALMLGIAQAADRHRMKVPETSSLLRFTRKATLPHARSKTVEKLDTAVRHTENCLSSGETTDRRHGTAFETVAGSSDEAHTDCEDALSCAEIVHTSLACDRRSNIE
jgi:hypothetical protein